MGHHPAGVKRVVAQLRRLCGTRVVVESQEASVAVMDPLDIEEVK